MNLGKNVVRKSIKCVNIKQRKINPFIGVLSEVLVTRTPPFALTGIDYAGPFPIKKNHKVRSKVSKVYI